jgi:PAB1-binding protein PBP1
LERIRANTAKWSKEEKNLARRVLDAERVSKELEGVMSKIHAANERFLV